jgi:hypothetical protein
MEERERAARYSDLFEAGHEHPTSECAYCPICVGLAVVRRTNPEVIEHLALAARELLAAAALVLAEAEKVVGAPPNAPTAEGEPKVRRLDIG